MEKLGYGRGVLDRFRMVVRGLSQNFFRWSVFPICVVRLTEVE